jgi:cell division GTPase FtsZ
MAENDIDVSEFLDVALDEETSPSSGEPEILDANEVGLRFGFIGAGQGGCNLVSTFWESFGYRRCVLFNTTAKDLAHTSIPQSNHVVPAGFDGAGKNRERGREAAVAAKADVHAALQQRIKTVDYLFVVSSAGGGSGSGATPVLADIAVQYIKQLTGLTTEEATKRVGIITMLPERADGSAVVKNAGQLLSEITINGRSKYGPMLLIDNQRVKVMGKGTLGDWQEKSNKLTARLFDIFNALSARDSRVATFDPTDYTSVLSSGIITIGLNILRHGIEQETSISAQLRANLSSNLLVDGLDLSSGTHAALLIVSDEKNLSAEHSNVALQRASETLLALLGNSEEKSVMLHQGVYSSKQPVVIVYSIIGGLTIAQSKLNQYV